MGKNKQTKVKENIFSEAGKRKKARNKHLREGFEFLSQFFFLNFYWNSFSAPRLCLHYMAQVSQLQFAGIPR